MIVGATSKLEGHGRKYSERGGGTIETVSDHGIVQCKLTLLTHIHTHTHTIRNRNRGIITIRKFPN